MASTTLLTRPGLIIFTTIIYVFSVISVSIILRFKKKNIYHPDLLRGRLKS